MKGTISFTWWNANNPKEEIAEEHKTELEQHAFQRAVSMRSESYICGELLMEIEGINYRGSWEFSE